MGPRTWRCLGTGPLTSKGCRLWSAGAVEGAEPFSALLQGHSAGGGVVRLREKPERAATPRAQGQRNEDPERSRPHRLRAQPTPARKAGSKPARGGATWMPLGAPQ